MAKLNSQQRERFAVNVVSGMVKTDAYRDAYPKAKGWTDNTVRVRACNLSKEPDVAQRIAELQDQLTDDAILTAKERMIMLSDIAQDIEESTRNRIQAIDLLNKMDGLYVQKVDAQVSSVADTAEKVAAIVASVEL